MKQTINICIPVIMFLLLFVNIQQIEAKLIERDSVDYVQLKNVVQRNKFNSERLERNIIAVKQEIDTISIKLDSMSLATEEVSKYVAFINDSINHQKGHIVILQDELGQLKDRLVISCIVLLFLLLATALTLVNIFRKTNNLEKKQSDENARFADIQERVISFYRDFVESRKELLLNNSSANSPHDEDHSLALRIAGEITRIEVNLSRMDPNIKGYKQLSASIRRIKDCYTANGYEIVDMLGKPYNEGLNVIANFVPDESLKEGQQIITGVVKPQVNYNGILIQVAQVTVSQN